MDVDLRKRKSVDLKKSLGRLTKFLASAKTVILVMWMANSTLIKSK